MLKQIISALKYNLNYVLKFIVKYTPEGTLFYRVNTY
jgi:hypothetical protein